MSYQCKQIVADGRHEEFRKSRNPKRGEESASTWGPRQAVATAALSAAAPAKPGARHFPTFHRALRLTLQRRGYPLALLSAHQPRQLERLLGAVADAEAGVVCLIDRPGRWEAAHGIDDSAISALPRKRPSANSRANVAMGHEETHVLHKFREEYEQHGARFSSAKATSSSIACDCVAPMERSSSSRLPPSHRTSAASPSSAHCASPGAYVRVRFVSIALSHSYSSVASTASAPVR